MEQVATRTAEPDEVQTLFVELAIVLVTSRSDPSILNPDFLRHNGIVDKGLPLTRSPVSTPMFSQVEFDEGITIRADPDRFVFEQRGHPLSNEACLAPTIASKFIETVPTLGYVAVGVNPKRILPTNNSERSDTLNFFVDQGDWTSFDNIRPNGQFRTYYEFDDRTVSIELKPVVIKEDDEVVSNGLSYSANVHRDVSEEGEWKSAENARKILGRWEEDVKDFERLVRVWLPRA